MKGKLYGIGAGPGDPELLTLKAVKTLEKCGVIALPNAGNSERTAFKIVEAYCGGKRLLECGFSMEKDERKRKALRSKAADDICAVLDTGEDVGFITLGDPTVYSTYMYVHKLVGERGYATEIVSGIPSFIAAAAALNDSLCEGSEALHIIPASGNERLFEQLLLPGNKVIMKAGGGMSRVLSELESKGEHKSVKIVERCTMDGERVYGLKELSETDNAGYYSVIVVKE